MDWVIGILLTLFGGMYILVGFALPVIIFFTIISLSLVNPVYGHIYNAYPLEYFVHTLFPKYFALPTFLFLVATIILVIFDKLGIKGDFFLTNPRCLFKRGFILPLFIMATVGIVAFLISIFLCLIIYPDNCIKILILYGFYVGTLVFSLILYRIAFGESPFPL